MMRDRYLFDYCVWAAPVTRLLKENSNAIVCRVQWPPMYENKAADFWFAYRKAVVIWRCSPVWKWHNWKPTMTWHTRKFLCIKIRWAEMFPTTRPYFTGRGIYTHPWPRSDYKNLEDLELSEMLRIPNMVVLDLILNFYLEGDHAHLCTYAQKE